MTDTPLPETPKPPIDKKSLILGLAKGIAVLESFDTERQRLNATSAAQRAGITRAAARRCLLTLASIGYLETDGSYYWLSPKVLRLSGSYLASARLPRLVQHSLDRLAAETGSAFSATVLDKDEVVVIARSGSNRSLRAYGVHLGARLAAHATSTGRVLLAALGRRELNEWVGHFGLRRLTQRTVTAEEDFFRVVDEVRQLDYCIASEEHELGVWAIAVPLRDMKGRTVAALNSIHSTQGARAAEMKGRLLGLLQDTARELRPTI